MVADQPPGMRTLGRHPHNPFAKQWGDDLHHPQPFKLAGFCNLLDILGYFDLIVRKHCIYKVLFWLCSQTFLALLVLFLMILWQVQELVQDS